MMYYLGIDGGGAKTEGALLDERGGVRAEVRVGGSAIVGEPHPEACAVLRHVKSELLSRAKLPAETNLLCGLGLSGIDFDDEIQVQQACLAETLGVPPEQLKLVNDGIVALWGATAQGEAALLQHGTSFTSAYRSAYGEEELFDHLGVCRCFDIRTEALRCLARMLAGVCEPNRFASALLDHFSLSPQDFPATHWRGNLDPEGLARLPSLLYELWEGGNATVDGLMLDAVADYSAMLRAMLKRLPTGKAVAVLGGGVLHAAPPRFWNRIQQSLPEVAVQKARFKPSLGAAIMAAHFHGADTAALYRALRKESQ